MNADPQLWHPLIRSKAFGELAAALEADRGGACLTGTVAGARALVLSLLAMRTKRALMLVVPDDAAADAWRRELAAVDELLGRPRDGTLLFPALDADPYDDIAPHPEVVRERVVALGRLAAGDAATLLVPVRALVQWLPSPQDWSEWSQRFAVGQTIGPDRFVLGMLSLGYRRADTVSAPGEVSRRGGIIDVYPPNQPEPVRIELFGDQIESLRRFDTDHQRSTGTIDEVTVGPAVENPPTDEAVMRLTRYLEHGRADAGDDVKTVRHLRKRLDELTEHGYWPGVEALAKMCVHRPTLLFDHARSMTLVVDEPERTDHELLTAIDELSRSFSASGDHVLPAPDELFASAADVRERLRAPGIFVQELSGDDPAGATAVVSIPSRPSRAYDGRIQELVADLNGDRERGRRTVCVMRAQGGADRLREILDEYDVPASSFDASVEHDDTWAGGGGVFVGFAPLREGFEFPEHGLTVLAEREVFGERRKSQRERSGRANAAFVTDFRDLKRGDVIVHVDHGIATYGGLGRPKGGSMNRDFMVLEFAAGDKLFVPVDRLDLVQRYTGAGGAKPKLDKLGGPGWERVKSKVRKSVRSMAKELLELYARRAAATGHTFSPDTAWQHELEASFPFELTRDQQRAVGEVKNDMESPRTMDRLLVGDVGFGKTEVAVRAAFKAVMDGKQVALLAPTTVLAFQHFNTFSERFAPFPVRVEHISRFRTAGETTRVLEDLALGQVDVLIGTHRILSKDVEFPKLGLVVVDEEQRFGVAHKERLKQLALGVDVLSMTATPIPRTLQMSLAGVRDLSVIETPPPGRMAIKSYIIPFRTNVLAQAIRQEVRRGGQVYVVHNRIETLPSVVRAVREMAPGARIAMAHGRLPEKKLEQVMLGFVRGEADVLVTTSIIENGLDIPRANTIIVNRADRMGLAQLYQLRGRVGRSSEHAYAYFVVPGRQLLGEVARKRMKALQEFSELGAGFRLAAADLEIRGAGELLGSRQHGHIAALGFDMYCQMLERAVRELQGDPVPERRPPGLHLGIDVKVPDTWIGDAGDRLALYKRLASTRSPAEVDDLQTETEDRFGHLPAQVVSLFEMARLRLVAEQAGVKTIDFADSQLQIRFHDEPPLEPERVVLLVAQEQGSMTPSGMVRLPAPDGGDDRIGSVMSLLQRMLGVAA